MMADSPKFPDWLPLLVAVGLLCGCAAFPAGMERREPGAHYLPPDRSLEVMDRLDGLNRSLATFKGVGKANLAAEGQRRSARIVWVGMAPDKLRIEILGVPGQPAASIALDGEWITFDPHTPDRFYRRRIGDDSLQPILSIAINAPDLIDLLRGRLPIRDHATAVLFRPPGAGGFVLQLEKRWWGIQQKIFPRAAPATFPDLMASQRSASLTMPPRAQLIRRTPSFILSKAALPISPSVSLNLGTWTVM